MVGISLPSPFVQSSSGGTTHLELGELTKNISRMITSAGFKALSALAGIGRAYLRVFSCRIIANTLIERQISTGTVDLWESAA
jgi:hypothetical protein